jgi:hypothetical protein
MSIYAKAQMLRVILGTSFVKCLFQFQHSILQYSTKVARAVSTQLPVNVAEVFYVKNYESEAGLEPEKNALILYAVKVRQFHVFVHSYSP